MPIPSKETAAKILETIETVNNMTGPTTQRPRRRIRTGGGGGSIRVLIRLNALSQSGEANEWAGDIVSQRLGSGVEVTEDITIWAPHMVEGELPLTGAPAARFWRADAVSNVENIPDALNAANPIPATVYEIYPPVFLGV
jgi:hypothetical protein